MCPIKHKTTLCVIKKEEPEKSYIYIYIYVQLLAGGCTTLRSCMSGFTAAITPDRENLPAAHSSCEFTAAVKTGTGFNGDSGLIFPLSS